MDRLQQKNCGEHIAQMHVLVELLASASGVKIHITQELFLLEAVAKKSNPDPVTKPSVKVFNSTPGSVAQCLNADKCAYDQSAIQSQDLIFIFEGHCFFLLQVSAMQKDACRGRSESALVFET